MVNPRDIKIVNVVVSSAIGTEIKDLRELARALDRAEYNPQQFPGLVYRTDDPKTADTHLSIRKNRVRGREGNR